MHSTRRRTCLVPVPVVDLPLGATEDRVVGALDLERALSQDAMAAARSLRAAALTSLLLDTSAQPQPGAQRLAEAMGAAYLPLPYADSAAMSQAVRLASAPTAAAR